MKEIQEHKIKIYEFPDTEDDEDNKLIRKIKVNNRKWLLFYIKALKNLICVQTSYSAFDPSL